MLGLLTSFSRVDQGSSRERQHADAARSAPEAPSTPKARTRGRRDERCAHCCSTTPGSSSTTPQRSSSAGRPPHRQRQRGQPQPHQPLALRSASPLAAASPPRRSPQLAHDRQRELSGTRSSADAQLPFWHTTRDATSAHALRLTSAPPSLGAAAAYMPPPVRARGGDHAGGGVTGWTTDCRPSTSVAAVAAAATSSPASLCALDRPHLVILTRGVCTCEACTCAVWQYAYNMLDVRPVTRARYTLVCSERACTARGVRMLSAREALCDPQSAHK
jgi:hypothetical protein